MIKKIIFDLDNTLIMWDDEYYNTLDDTLHYFNIKYDDNIKNNLIKAIDNYESIYNKFNMNSMKLLMEKYANIKLPNDFVYKWTLYLENCYPKEKDKDLIETLEYLNKKYELVVLTNWFKIEQENRLKNYDILKYFKEVIGTENIPNKPNKKAFIEASKPYKIGECIMIGDSLKKDVEGALNIGMDAILFDYNDNYKGKYKKINEIKELKNIL
jgi:putative hydrolase of the HAD superfamily